MSNEIREAEAVLSAAIERYFPDLALIASGTPEDAVLVDLLIRINPDVKIFWLGDEAGLEAVKAKYYVTPIRVKGPLARAVREWGLQAILRSERREPVYRREGGVDVVRPLAFWSAPEVRAYLRENAVPAEVRS